MKSKNVIAAFLPFFTFVFLVVQERMYHVDVFETPVYISLFFTSLIMAISIRTNFSLNTSEYNWSHFVGFWSDILVFVGFLTFGFLALKDDRLELFIFFYAASMQFFLSAVIVRVATFYIKEKNKVVFLILIVSFTSFINSLQLPSYAAGANIFGSFYFLPYYLYPGIAGISASFIAISQLGLILVLVYLINKKLAANKSAST